MIARPKLDIFGLMIEDPRIAYCIRLIYSQDSRSLVWGGGCYRKDLVHDGPGCRANGTGDGCQQKHVRKVRRVESQSSDDDCSSGRAHSPKSSLCNCEQAARCCCDTEDVVSPAVETGISELSEAAWRKIFNKLKVNGSPFTTVQAGLRSQALNSNEPELLRLPLGSAFQIALCVFSETEQAVYEFGIISGQSQLDLQGDSRSNKLVEKLCSKVKGYDNFAPRRESPNDLGEVDETDVIKAFPQGLDAEPDDYNNGVLFCRPAMVGEYFHPTESASALARSQNGDNNTRPVGVSRMQKCRAAGVLLGNYTNEMVNGYGPKFSLGLGQGVADARENLGQMSLHLQAATNFSGVDGMNAMRHGTRVPRFTRSEQSFSQQGFGGSESDMKVNDWPEDQSFQWDTNSGASDLILGSTYSNCPSPTSGLCSNLPTQESAAATNLSYQWTSFPNASLVNGVMCSSHLASDGVDQVIQGQGGILDQGEIEVMYRRVPFEDNGASIGEASSRWYSDMTDSGFPLRLSEEGVDDASDESSFDDFLKDNDQEAGEDFEIMSMEPSRDGIGLGIADDRPCNTHQSVAPVNPDSLEQLLATAGTYGDPTGVLGISNVISGMQQDHGSVSGESAAQECFREKNLLTVPSQEHVEPMRKVMVSAKKRSGSRNATYQVSSRSPTIHPKPGKSQATCPMPDVDCGGGASNKRFPRAGSGDGGVSSLRAVQSTTRSSQPSLTSPPVTSLTSSLPPLLQSLKPEIDGGSKPEVSCSEGGEKKLTQKNSTERKRPRRGGANQAQTQDKVMTLYDDPDECEEIGKGPGKRRHPEPNSTAIAERDRRRRMNMAFEALRGRVPDAPRRGKADLLECATRYIKQLQDLEASQGVSRASLAAEGKGNDDKGPACECEDTLQAAVPGVESRQQTGGACETSTPEKERNWEGRLSAGNEDSESDVGLQSDAASTGAVSMDEDPVAMKLGQEKAHRTVKVISRRWVAENPGPSEVHEASGKAPESTSAGAGGKTKGMDVDEDEGSHPTSPSMASQGVVICKFRMSEEDGCVQRVLLSYPAEECRENCFARVMCQLARLKIQVRRSTMDIEKGWIQVNIGFEDDQGLSESSQVLCELEESLREIFFQAPQELCNKPMVWQGSSEAPVGPFPGSPSTAK